MVKQTTKLIQIADETEAFRNYLAFRKNMFISDDRSMTDTPHYDFGVWAHETGCICSTCKTLRA